jgi:Flp pilus assembly CpaF family ATPase
MASTFVDAMLPDSSRLHVVIPDIAVSVLDGGVDVHQYRP